MCLMHDQQQKVELSDPINGRSSQQMAWHAIIKDRGKIKPTPSAGQLKKFCNIVEELNKGRVILRSEIWQV